MTPRSFIVHPAAIAEAKHAAQWYRERNPDVAERFVLEYEQALDRIVDAPERWPPYLLSTRHIKTPSFPFLVTYHVTEVRLLH